jgi:hypothetical protein
MSTDDIVCIVGAKRVRGYNGVLQADARVEQERKKQARKAMKRLEYCMICRHTSDLGDDDEKLICRGR